MPWSLRPRMHWGPGPWTLVCYSKQYSRWSCSRRGPSFGSSGFPLWVGVKRPGLSAYLDSCVAAVAPLLGGPVVHLGWRLVDTCLLSHIICCTNCSMTCFV